MKHLMAQDAGIIRHGTIGIPEEFLPPEHEHLIAFEVAGNCMNGDKIFDGDVVIVDPELLPAHGDIAVFGMMNSAGRLAVTLKRMSRSEGAVRLVPSNPAHASVINEDDLFISGTVVATVHRIS
jgi:SOS-response transcriptional repressor LexA